MWRSAARSIGACLALLCFFAVSSADPSPPSRADVTSGVRVAQRLIDTIPSPWRLDGDVRMAGDDAPVAQGNFVQASYALNKASLDSVATSSRAGNAMQFDSSGYLTYGPNNLLTQSNTFTNAAWSKNGSVSLTTGVTDPLGGTNATTLTAIAAGAEVFRSVSGNASTNYIAAIYMRRRTGTGSVTIYKPDDTGPVNIAPLLSGGGWVLVSNNGAGAASTWFDIVVATSGDAIDLYQASLAAVTYETTPRTQDQVITTSAAYYGPRFDNTYNGSSWVPAGLLVEGAATNSAYQAFNIADAGWAAAGGSKSNATDLSGGNTAQLFTPSAVNTTHYLRYASAGSLTNATVYTMTAYVKFGGAPFIWIGDSSGSSWVWGSVNTSTLAVATAGTVSSSMATPVAMGGGVYKLQLTWTRDLTVAVSPVVLPYTATSSGYGNVGYPTWAATGTETFTLLGLQVEAGTFGSSPIITGASAVTRAAETVQLTGTALSTLRGASGTAIVQTTDMVTNSSISQTLLGLANGATMGYPLFYWPSNSKITTVNASTPLSTAVTPTLTSPVRAGIAWSAAGRSIANNGGTVATDANPFSSAAVTGAYLGVGNGGALYWLNGHIASAAFYNSRLPDATLQAKATVGASYAANDNGIRYAFADNDNLPVHWRVAL